LAAGKRIEPGQNSFDEAARLSAPDAALVEEVDLLVLETFATRRDSSGHARGRDVKIKFPLVAQVTIDEDGIAWTALIRRRLSRSY